MKLRNTSKYLLVFILFSSFVLLSKYEDRPVIRNLDFDVTVKVQDFVKKSCVSRCDAIFEDIGFFASPLFSAIVVLFISIKRKSWFIPVFFILLTLAEIYGKTIVRHPAPPFFLLKNPTTVFPAYYVWQEFSYPSGHASRAMFLAFTSSSLINKMFLFSYVLLVSFSRIYLGHHWLSDVLGGWFLGGAMGVLTWIRYPHYNKSTMSD